LVTTDGSVADIPRASYENAEERVVAELKGINKPFVVLLNSRTPTSAECKALKAELEEKYQVPVVAVSCAELCEEDIERIIETVLFEFPLTEVKIRMPGWVMQLEREHWLAEKINSAVISEIQPLEKIRNVRGFCENLSGYDFIKTSVIDGIDLGSGSAVLDITAPEELFYKVLGEESGFEIPNEEALVKLIRDLSGIKSEYDKIAEALNQVKECGYGVVSPTIDEMTLEEPKIVKQGGRYGVRLKASAPSIHIV